MWLYKNKEYKEPDDNLVGFVYLIEEIDTGKKYIGKKNFWVTVKRKPRGKKRPIKVKRSSDWQNYYGSNKNLQENVNKNINNYKRTILHLCESKGLMSYLELEEQIKRRVLFKDEYYNSFIGGKIHQNHVLKGDSDEEY